MPFSQSTTRSINILLPTSQTCASNFTYSMDPALPFDADFVIVRQVVHNCGALRNNVFRIWSSLTNNIIASIPNMCVGNIATVSWKKSEPNTILKVQKGPIKKIDFQLTVDDPNGGLCNLVNGGLVNTQALISLTNATTNFPVVTNNEISLLLEFVKI